MLKAKDTFVMRTKEEEAKWESKWKFNRCVECEFYECELIGTYGLFKYNSYDGASLSYNPKESKGHCVLKHGLHQVDCSSSRYVSDGIGDHYKINLIEDHKLGTRGHRVERTIDNRIGDRTVNRWEPSQPIIISAQTGQGKNTFIEKTLLLYVRELNQSKGTNHKVLILSNRIALRKQILDRLAGASKTLYISNHL